MYKIATLNKIAKAGTDRFSANYKICDGANGLSDSTAVIVRSASMHDMEFDDSLLAIARAGAGVNNIPLDRCSDLGIAVFNTPGANANAVKELVIAALIICSRNIDKGIGWVNSLHDDPDIVKTIEKGKSQFKGHEIMGKTLGVVGVGAIGVRVSNAAVKLGMNVRAYEPRLGIRSAIQLDPSVEVFDSLEKMLPECDYVSLHLPAKAETKGMFNADLFSHFKDGACLINYARDTVVNEEDLIKSLKSGKLSKYITDFARPAFIGNEKICCTPHIGASTEEAEDNCAIMASDELIDYIENGNIVNSVNLPAVSLGKKLPAEKRLAIITKGESDPIKLISNHLSGVNINKMAAGKCGDYGYALISTDSDLNAVPKGDGIVRARII